MELMDGVDVMQQSAKRAGLIEDLLHLEEPQLLRRLNHIAARHEGAVANVQALPPVLRKMLSTTGGTVLVRQDLEPTLYALFVKRFPLWERLRHKPANGLVHAINQITATGSQTDATLMTGELGTVPDDTNVYQRQTFNIAVFAVRRGVSLKEQFAVQAGGMAAYNPETQEVHGGLLQLTAAIQRAFFTGNVSDPSGLASNEGGVYAPNGFDGLRQMLGSVSGTPYAGNGAVIVDQGALSITQAIGSAASQAADNGGTPSVIVMSNNNKFKLDAEQNNQVRYQFNTREVSPGVRVNMVNTPPGELPVITVPGKPMGSYNRTSDGTLVDDIYVLDESTISALFLGQEGFTVLEIPVAANGQLTQLYVIFAMYGMELAAPLFNAKVRIPV